MRQSPLVSEVPISRSGYVHGQADSAINSFSMLACLSPASLKPVSSVTLVLCYFVISQLFSTARRSDLIVFTLLFNRYTNNFNHTAIMYADPPKSMERVSRRDIFTSLPARVQWLHSFLEFGTGQSCQQYLL